MLNVPREAFVPPGREEAAYVGENLWLGPGRVLLEPRSFAKMLDALDLQPGERVLHVGAGLGYGAAVMARMGARVVALEEDGARAAAAAAALAREGAEVAVRHGPLTGGAPDLAPFDAIVIEGAVEEVPGALLAQVAPGGRIAAIFADGQLGTARLGREAAGQVHWRYLFNAGAPVLPGFQRIPAFVL
jgi:protein-L-isoaspartate(D-aspartate) O-methyltransferase